MRKWTERKITEAIERRTPKPVTTHYTYEDSAYGALIFELCPTCGNALDRTYQNYCSECGQKLKWLNKKTKPVESSDSIKSNGLIGFEIADADKTPPNNYPVIPHEQASTLAIAESKVESSIKNCE